MTTKPNRDLIEIHVLLEKPLTSSKSEAMGERIAEGIMTGGAFVGIENAYVADVRGEDEGGTP